MNGIFNLLGMLLVGALILLFVIFTLEVIIELSKAIRMAWRYCNAADYSWSKMWKARGWLWRTVWSWVWSNPGYIVVQGYGHIFWDAAQEARFMEEERRFEEERA